MRAGQAGFSLWDEWSQKSDKYDAQAATRKWRSFRSGSFQLESIFHAAMQGRVGESGVDFPPVPDPVPVESVKVAPVKKIQRPSSADLLRPPRHSWRNHRLGERHQPQTAARVFVQAAIAFASTVLGRRFSSQRNWPSLFLLNIGKSAAGTRQMGRGKLLEACELPT